MGLFSITPAQRFLDGASSDDVYAATQVLVSGFLHSMQVQTVYFKYGMHPLMRELAKKGGMGAAVAQRFGAGGKLLSSIGGDPESRDGGARIEAEAPDSAVATCAARMARLPVTPGVSQGISFGIDQRPDGPSTNWGLVIHRGPLPILAIELSDATGFKPPKTWLETIIKSKCADVVQSRLGDGDHLFLMLKRTKLFPYSKGDTNASAVAAGQRLRKYCREAWQEQCEKNDSFHELSSWQWRRRRFVRKFDRMLAEHAGSENLETILKEMGTRIESWLPACES